MSQPASALSLLQAYDGDEDETELEAPEVHNSLNLPSINSAPSVAPAAGSLNITSASSQALTDDGSSEEVLITSDDYKLLNNVDGPLDKTTNPETVAGLKEISQTHHLTATDTNVKDAQGKDNSIEHELSEDHAVNLHTNLQEDVMMQGDSGLPIGETQNLDNLYNNSEAMKIYEKVGMQTLRVIESNKLMNSQEDSAMQYAETSVISQSPVSSMLLASEVIPKDGVSEVTPITTMERQQTADVVVLPEQGDYRDSDTSDSDESSESEDSSSDSSIVISSGDEEPGADEDEPESGKKKNRKVPPEEEYCPGFLPAIEDLTISVEEKQCMLVGKIASIVDKMVVVQANKNTPALDEDSVLFLDTGKKTLGRIFDTFGCVSEPSYVVRFNSAKHVEERGVVVGAEVYCAPQTEHSHFILISQLLKMKGSDASWKNDMEVPPELQEYSDDEQERAARRQRKSQKDNNRVEIIYEGERPPSKRGRGRGAPRTQAPRGPYQSQVQDNPFAAGRGSFRPRQNEYAPPYQPTGHPPPVYQPPLMQAPPAYQPQYYRPPPPAPPTFRNYPPPPSPTFGGNPGWPSYPPQQSATFQGPPRPQFQQYYPPGGGYVPGAPPGYPPPQYGYQ